MPNEPLPLSVFVIALNEADRLGPTLEAARGLTDDLVVVDAGAPAGTPALAAARGAPGVHREWAGVGAQKRFAEDACRHPWLLNLEADEVAPPALLHEIRALFAAGEPAADAFRIGIAEVFPVEDRPHRFAYALWPVRLYRRDRGRYVPSPVHDRVELVRGARVGRLRAVLHHRSVRSLGDQVAKLNRYSDRQADDLAARGVSLPTGRIFVEFPLAFLKAYLVRRHVLRGAYGFLTAMNYAIARHLRVAKHYERRRLDAQRKDGRGRG